jgi:hypothetical protein
MSVAGRRNTEVSGFTLFEGDSWRSSNDNSSATNEDLLDIDMIRGTKSVRSSDEQVDAEQLSIDRDREDADDSSRLEDEDLESTIHTVQDVDGQVPPQSTDRAGAEKEESSTSSQHEDELDSIHVDSETDGDDSIQIIQLPIASDENSLSISEHLNSFRDEHYNESRKDVLEEHSHEEELLPPEHQEELIETSWIPLQNSDRREMHYNQQPDDDNGTNRRVSFHASARQKKKKKLTPAKKRRRFIMCLMLFLFCAGTAGAAYWFILYFLDDLRQEQMIADSTYAASDPKGEEAIIIKPIDTAVCVPFTVIINTDSFGNETSWVLSYFLDSNIVQDEHDDVYYEKRYHYSFTSTKRKRLRRHIGMREMQPLEDQELAIGSGGPYYYLDMTANNQITPGQYNSSFCLAKGSYRFDIYDSSGDGFVQGSYRLEFEGGRVVHTSSFELQSVESTVFDVTDGDIVAVLSSTTPSNSMIPTTLQPPSIAPSSSPLKSFTTASGSSLFADAGKSYGMIFDIQTNQNISSVLIVGMELLVYVNNYVDYEVWTAKGSWRELNVTKDVPMLSSFDLVANGTLLGRGVCESCGFSSIPLAEFGDVLIDGAKTVQSFYITLSSDSLVFKGGSEVTQSCDSFVVSGGSAVLAYPMKTIEPTLDLSDNKAFVGVIYYESEFQDILSTAHPTRSPHKFIDSSKVSSILLPSRMTAYQVSISDT